MTATELRPQATAPATALAAAPAAAPATAPRPYPTAHVDLTPPERPRFSLLHVPYLPNAVRESRHRMLIAILAVHVPLLILLGMDRHHGSRDAAIVALPVLVATLAARFLRGREARSIAVVLGLAWASYAVVYLDGGAPEAYLHPLFVVVLVALYQDPLLLGVGVLALAAACAVPAALHPALVFAPRSAELNDPWPWTGLHVLAVLGVAGAAALSWRRDVPVPVFADPAPGAAEPEPDPEVAEQIARVRAAELALARRQASYALMTNLARRNQSLVGRQLATLDDLERDERDPDVLAGLFALDHLATRMRRNAENLLVLAGAPGSTTRSFARPVPVDELLRGAAAEVEQYARVTVSVGADGGVAGHVVSDVAHLLAELLDNALTCSPPDSEVVVGAAPSADGGLRLWVADGGIGMTAQRMAEHNAVLSDTSEEAEVGASLGFPVVRRLAARHGIHVSLGAREGGQQGLVAYVDLPADLVVGTMAEVPATPAPAGDPETATALPGRRAAKRLSPAAVRTRRNQLAHEVAAEAWFQPAPLPTDGPDDAKLEDGYAAPDAPDTPDRSVAPLAPAPLGEPDAPDAPDVPVALAAPVTPVTLAGLASPQPAEDGLPTRRRAAGTGAEDGVETAPLDLAALREQFAVADERAGETFAIESLAVETYPAEAATAEPFAPDALAADTLSPDAATAEPYTPETVAPDTFVPDTFAAEPATAEPYTPEPLAAEPFSADTFAPGPIAAEPFSADTFAPGPIAADTFSGEPEIWTASGRWDTPVPSSAAYDDILFGSAPVAEPEAPAPQPSRGAGAATVLPGAPLARRVPLQSLRDAGVPAVFEPGPAYTATWEAPTDTDPAGPDAVVDPEHATDMFAAYRAGLARARTVGPGTDPDTVLNGSTETPGEFA